MPVGSSAKNGNGQREKEAKANGDDESSNSEGESSSYDEDDSERKKVDCLDDMQYLEQQFTDLKELLFHEKVQEIDRKILDVNKERAVEYLQPLKELDEALQQRLDTAAIHHQCRANNIHSKFEEEVQSAQQDYREFCAVKLEQMKAELEEKVRRLHEEAVITRLTQESSTRKRKLKGSEFQLPEKRKKPVTVTGPCVVYMLRDMDIMEDLHDIRRGRAVQEVEKKLKSSWSAVTQ